MDKTYRIVYRYSKESFSPDAKRVDGKTDIHASDLAREGAEGVVKAVEKAAGIPALSPEDSSPLWDEDKRELLKRAIGDGEYSLAYPSCGLITRERHVVMDPDFEDVVSDTGFSLHFDYDKRRNIEAPQYRSLPDRMRSSYDAVVAVYDKEKKLSPDDLKKIVSDYKDEGMGK